MRHSKYKSCWDQKMPVIEKMEWEVESLSRKEASKFGKKKKEEEEEEEFV